MKFVNERGNEIDVNARVTEGGDIEISIVGPHSEIAALVTVLEAKHIREALDDVLDDKP